MPWSAETALNELWAGLDLTATHGEIRSYLKERLQRAYEQGRCDALGQLGGVQPLSPERLAALST